MSTWPSALHSSPDVRSRAMEGTLQPISFTTYLMPFTATPVSHGPGTRAGRHRSSPFQVVIRRPILAAFKSSCEPKVLDCLSQSPVVSPGEWLRVSGFVNIPKVDWKG